MQRNKATSKIPPKIDIDSESVDGIYEEYDKSYNGEWVRWEDVEKYVREEVLGANKLGDKTVFFTETGVYISKDKVSE